MGLSNSKERREVAKLREELNATLLRVESAIIYGQDPDPEDYVVLRGNVERIIEIAEQIKERPGVKLAG